jgi:hypothetical protein
MLLDPCLHLLFYFTLQRHAHVVPRGTVVCSNPISNYIDYNKPYLHLLTGNWWILLANLWPLVFNALCRVFGMETTRFKCS